MSKQNEQKREENKKYSQTSWLETWKSFSYPITTKNPKILCNHEKSCF
jgi:hypothetical protein